MGERGGGGDWVRSLGYYIYPVSRGVLLCEFTWHAYYYELEALDAACETGRLDSEQQVRCLQYGVCTYMATGKKLNLVVAGDMGFFRWPCSRSLSCLSCLSCIGYNRLALRERDRDRNCRQGLAQRKPLLLWTGVTFRPESKVQGVLATGRAMAELLSGPCL